MIFPKWKREGKMQHRRRTGRQTVRRKQGTRRWIVLCNFCKNSMNFLVGGVRRPSFPTFHAIIAKGLLATNDVVFCMLAMVKHFYATTTKNRTNEWTKNTHAKQPTVHPSFLGELLFFRSNFLWPIFMDATKN